VNLDDAADRFDAVYSQLTLLQRRLIAARRGELDADDENELIEQAAVFTRAFQTAERALAVGGLSAAELEGEALGARVLHKPVDEHLLLAALRSQRRAEAYPLLAAALRMSVGELPASLAERSLLGLLAAPRGMGERSAQDLLGVWGLEPDVLLGDLPDDASEQLCARIDDAALELPEAVRRTRGQKPAAPADGHDAGDRVLNSWIDASGAPSNGVRPLLAAAARREDWPSDAAPVALLLASFARTELLPALLGDDWAAIAEIADVGERIQAVREQSRVWWEAGDRETQMLSILLRCVADMMNAERRLRAMDGDYSTPRPGPTAMQLSRTIARRCGEILGGLEAEDAEQLLASLPLPKRLRPGQRRPPR
jgi:hypothetical protein